ncbi:phage portal protein [Weissella muntiaci]|uniref:Phage portal protein n=1 Tax=Weissella muntiaci TaxID=2508881 RepID=A0A6C2C9W7_9LACO|nr:phage portal protein [Weissella muntiaci]TYC50727.1 phage portal protein [Weissella muntiaci]
MSFKNPFENVRSSISATSVSSYIVTSGSVVPNSLVGAELALQNSDLFSVTSLISSDIAGTKFVGSSPFIKLLNRPSRMTNSFSFWQTTLLNLLLSGNAFLFINRDADGNPVDLQLVPNTAVTIDLTQDVLTYEINRFDDYEGGKFPASDIIHAKYMAYGSDSLHNIIGHSPLESLSAELGQQKQASRLSLSTLKNAINPTVKITIPQGTLTEEAKEAVRVGYEKMNSGKNAGRPLVMDQSADLSMISINADIAKFLSSVDWGRTQISKAFGVPDSYLNGTGDAQSSLEMATQMYVNGLNRYIEPLLSELNYKLGGGVELDMMNIVDYSGATYKQNMIDFVDKAVLTPEDARSRLIERKLI